MEDPSQRFNHDRDYRDSRDQEYPRDRDYPRNRDYPRDQDYRSPSDHYHPPDQYHRGGSFRDRGRDRAYYPRDPPYSSERDQDPYVRREPGYRGYPSEPHRFEPARSRGRVDDYKIQEPDRPNDDYGARRKPLLGDKPESWPEGAPDDPPQSSLGALGLLQNYRDDPHEPSRSSARRSEPEQPLLPTPKRPPLLDDPPVAPVQESQEPSQGAEGSKYLTLLQ